MGVSNLKAGPKIAFLLDERVSHERISLLKRTLQELQATFEMDIIKPGELPEPTLFTKLTQESYSLIALPYYRYAASAKLEAALNSQKVQTKLFGYFCEPLSRLPIEWKRLSNDQRILLDFENLEANELVVLIQNILDPIFLYQPLGYQDEWYENRGIGYLFDHLFLTSELRQEIWQWQGASIRLILCALWGMTYERPFFRTQSSSATERSSKASFFFSVQSQTLLLQLFFQIGGLDPKKGFLETFWPLSEGISTDLKLLKEASDFLQIHWLSERNEIRITAGLFSSKLDQEKGELRNLIFSQIPNQPDLKKAPLLSSDSTSLPDKLKHELRALKSELAHKTAYIAELKKGGVGSSHPLPSPDADGLLEAFQNRYFETKLRLKELKNRVQELKSSPFSELEIQKLQDEISTLTQKERDWIKRLAQTLLAFKDRD